MPSSGGNQKWIQKATSNKGGLHRSLGIPEGESIPVSMLDINPGDSTKVKRQKTLAKTLRRFKHG